jgi:pimeloyl-ACP methyl ester carboxylesterase
MTETLLLVNTMSYAQQTERAVRQRELDRLRSQVSSVGERAAAADAVRERWPDLATTDPARFQRLVDLNQERVEAIAQTLQSYLDIGSSLEARLGELTMPTLILHGDADSRIPLACGQQLQNGIRQAELYIIPGAEHGLLSNEPRLVRNVIYGFLERVTPTVAATSPT